MDAITTDILKFEKKLIIFLKTEKLNYFMLKFKR